MSLISAIWKSAPEHSHRKIGSSGPSTIGHIQFKLLQFVLILVASLFSCTLVITVQFSIEFDSPVAILLSRESCKVSSRYN